MNRKYYSLEYVFGMLAFLVSMPMHAYDFQSGGIYYAIERNHAAVTYGNSVYQGRIEIPSQVTYDGKTYPVTSIGVSAFDGGSGITYLSIPSSITSIGEYAFINCGSDMEVSVESMESWCRVTFGNELSCPLSCAKEFYLNGSAVRSLVIPDGITSIPNFAFYQCRSITSLTLSNSVYSIGSSAFENCTGLTSVDLSTGLSLISGSAFEGCSAISSITFPGTVTAIAINAFKNCTSLNTIFSEIQEPFAIDDNVFSTYSTATLIVPYGTKAAYQATEGWRNFERIADFSEFTSNDITYVVKSSKTVAVKSSANHLKRVVIPESVSYNGVDYQVTALADHSFEGRSDITYLSIPNSVTDIGEYAFYDCGNDMDVNISSLEAWCRIRFGDPYACPLSSAKILYLNEVEVKDLTIPDGVDLIASFAFFQCRSIVSLTIPSSVKSIGSSAFEDCVGLTSVVFSRGLTLISGSAFEGCTGLSSITIPSTVTSIEINAFKESVNLNNITSEIQYPFAIDENVFSTYATATLKVPYGTKSLYQATAGWNNFSNIIDGTESKEFTKDGITYETISSETIKVKSVAPGSVSIEIPSSVSYDGTTYQVTGIADGAFDGCNLAALIWNVEAAMPSNAFSNAGIESNFLLYVKSASYAPSSVKNVVVDGTAQTVELSDDGGQFFCPQAFVARSISYAHNYSMETGGNGMGWEAIALPFDVQRIEHSTKGEIVPFGSYNSGSNQKPFWLANFSGSGFKYTSAIKANEPYIIAMPNSSKYRSEYNLAGDVTFSSENVQVPKTPSFSGTFLPAFATVVRSSSVYALNVNNRYVKYSGNFDAGSHFISNLRDVRPFEAYISEDSTRGFIEINHDDGTTEMMDILIFADKDQEITIYTMSGQLVDRINLRDFNLLWSRMSKGVYIINGKKWMK